MYPVIGPPAVGPRPRSGPAPIESPLAIELDIPCATCGYILRGLKTDASCPECHSPIAQSVVNNSLKSCDPRYTRALRFGAIIASASLFIQLAITSIAMFVFIFFEIFGHNIQPPDWFQYLAWTAIFILPPFTAGGAIFGWFLITTPDPAAIATPADPSWRRTLRIVIGIQIICWLVLVGFGLMNVLASIPPGIYIPIAAACGIATPFAILTHAALAAFYFRVLSPRLNTEFAEVLISYHHWSTAASTVMILLCFTGIWIRSEPFMICCVIGAYLALAALACTHLAMLHIIRRAAHTQTTHTRPG